MEVKAGDRIKIVRKGTYDWVDAEIDHCGEGGMDNFVGRTLAVEGVCRDVINPLVAVKVKETHWTFYSDSFEVVKDETFVADGVVKVLETKVKEKKVKKRKEFKMATNLYGVFDKDGSFVRISRTREEAREDKRWLDEAYRTKGKHVIMKLVPEKKVR